MEYKLCNGIGEQPPCPNLTKRYRCRKFKCELAYTKITSKTVGNILNVEPCAKCRSEQKGEQE